MEDELSGGEDVELEEEELSGGEEVELDEDDPLLGGLEPDDVGISPKILLSKRLVLSLGGLEPCYPQTSAYNLLYNVVTLANMSLYNYGTHY